jgi:hypothetical protein
MRGFIAAGRLDNTIEGDEFGNYNFSHDLFMVSPSPVTVFGPGGCPALH